MKNFKKIAFGLVVGALALGFSAFTTAHTTTTIHKAKTARMTIENFLVQDQGAGGFSQSSSFSSSNCGGTATLDCGYTVTTSGQSHIPNQSTYNASDINSYVTQGWLTPAPGASAKQYTD